MKHTLVQLLHKSVERFPDNTAVVAGAQCVSYRALWEQACGLAKYLVSCGLKPGDRVSLLIENSPEYIVAYYGVLMAGGAAIGLNTAAKSRDLVNWIEHSESSQLIASSTHPELTSVLENTQQRGLGVVMVGAEPDDSPYKHWNDIAPASAPPQNAMAFDPSVQLASIIYTSGTTGHPKGVMLSHNNLYQNVQSIIEYLKITKDDSIVNVLPFYYSYGNSVLHTHLAAGGKLILENSMLYPQKVVSLLQDSKATGFSGVPSTFNLLLSRTNLEDFDLSSLRYLTQAGGAMSPSSIERVKRVLPDVSFFVMYGQTEASARLSYLPPEFLESKLGSIGIAIPGVDLQVKDDRGEAVEPRITGEIYARGDNIMLGYWRDEAETSKVKDGAWLKTGDLAYKDEDGFLYIVGRSSEMIKSGAHRISPKDVEEAILELEGVEEVAVVGVEDDLLGQVIKAVVVKSPKGELDRISLMRHCKSRLANYKLPKYIQFTDTIPKTASGKVQRFMLQD